MPHPTLGKITQEVERLYAIPKVLDKLLKVMGEKEPEIKAVVHSLKYEPTFTARLLRLANSAYYGLQQVDSVGDAVMRLGLSCVRQMAIQTSFKEMLDSTFRRKDMVIGKIWKHSVAVAVCARSLARELGKDAEEGYFTAGILHDAGLMLEYLVYPDLFVKLEQAIANYREDLLTLEKEQYGFTHVEVGLVFAQKWRLPEPLQQRLRWHHEPEASPEPWREDARIMRLADILSYRMEWNLTGFWDSQEEAAISDLQMDTEEVGVLLPLMMSEYQNGLSYFD